MVMNLPKRLEKKDFIELVNELYDDIYKMNGRKSIEGFFISVIIGDKTNDVSVVSNMVSEEAMVVIRSMQQHFGGDIIKAEVFDKKNITIH